MEQDDAFVPIPGLGHADAALIQSLLAAAGLDYHVHEGFGESPAMLFIRAADLAAVKELLSDYQVRSPGDAKMPIPW